MQTLLLDQNTWDLVLDINRNIAVASDPYSQAQDAASRIRLFSGELYYDTTQGVTYFQNILGKLPPLSLIKAQYIAAVLGSGNVPNVPGVTSCKVFITAITRQREIGGQVQITNSSGQTAAAVF